MKELWRAFVARLVYWLTPEPPLRRGICECNHIRCIHVGGKGRCSKGYPQSKEWPYGAECACRMYIPKKDDPSDPQPETPSPDELERIYNAR